MNTKSTKQSTNRDRRSNPKVPQGILFPKNIASVYIGRRPICGKTNASAEQTPEPYDDTTPSTLEGRRYTIQDSPEGSIVIIVRFSRVKDRDPLPSPRKKKQTSRVKDQGPLPSSRKKKAREDGVSPAPYKAMFTCNLLDSRTQQPCGNAFPRLTDLNRHQNTTLHVPEKRGFQCLLCSKKYVSKSWMHRHMRIEHRSNKDPDAKENRKDGQDSGLMEVPDSEGSDDLNRCSASNDVPRQTNTHGRVLDQNGAGHPDGGIPCSTTQTIARKRTFHEIIDLSEMPVDEIERYEPRPRRDDQSALGTSTSKDVKGLEECNAPQQQSAGSARSVVVPNREVQTGRVKGKTSVRQPAAPSDDTSRHPSHNATTTVSRFDETHSGKSSDQIIDHSLPPNQQPGTRAGLC